MLNDSLAIPAAAVVGIGLGLWLLVRGFAGRLEAVRIADTATSTIASVALGEVRVSGVVEPAEVLLSSALQDVPCVYYRSRVEQRGSDTAHAGFTDERAVGFRVRDDSGSLRVFPRGGRWDVPDRFDQSSSALDGAPAGLRLRSGAAFRPANRDRDAQVAELLTVRAPASPSSWSGWAPRGSGTFRYREARVEPGDVVTVLGRAIRFGDLPDPAGADVDSVGVGDPIGPHDPVITAARAAGILEATPEEAWGNAAIPGFGIGRPVRVPELDPRAAPAVLATPDEQAGFERTFDLAPDSLVLAADPEVRLVIALGAPAVAAGRHEDRFALGLLGAVLAAGSAVVLALSLGSVAGA